MAASEMKQAALRVASLAPADRTWILARLGQREREHLLAQLSMLDQLGAARLGAALAQVSAAMVPAPQNRPGAVEEPLPRLPRGDMTGLGRASAEKLLSVLAELPAPCVDIVAGALPSGRQHLLEAQREGASRTVHLAATPHLAAALVQVVERRLAATADAAGASPPPPAGTASSRGVQA